MRYVKRRELFDREVRALLTRLGAKSDPTQTVPWSCYVLDTAAGKLRLSVHTDLYLAKSLPWAKNFGTPWVAGRFDDVAAAVALLGQDEVNRFSGKWTHRYWKNWTDSFRGGLELLEYQLRRVSKEEFFERESATITGTCKERPSNN